jgi:hypothetical protein
MSIQKPGMMVHTCGSSYMGGISKETTVWGCPQAKVQDLKKITKAKTGWSAEFKPNTAKKKKIQNYRNLEGTISRYQC